MISVYFCSLCWVPPYLNHFLNFGLGYLIHIHEINILGIHFRKSKNYLNMEALSIDCRNKHWSQCFNQILISSTGYLTIHPAVVVQAALESRAACTTTAGHIEVEPADEIKIRLKHCGQCLFLQSMLSASIFKWIFDFRIWIPNVLSCTFFLDQNLFLKGMSWKKPILDQF